MEIQCKSCNKPFEKQDIIATLDGLFCSECLPEDVTKKFFTIHLSWSGVNALVDYIDGGANVDQYMIVEKIRDKLVQKILTAIKEIMDENEI